MNSAQLLKEWVDYPLCHELLDAMELLKIDPERGLERVTEIATLMPGLASMYLGDIYRNGWHGVAKSEELADHYLRESWTGGSVKGAQLLATFLVENSRHGEAFEIYSELSKRDDAVSLFVMGWWHYRGIYVEKDLAKSMQYLKNSSELGHLFAENILTHLMVRYGATFGERVSGLWRHLKLIIPIIAEARNRPNSDKLRRH